VFSPVLAVHETINFVRIPQPQVFVGADIDVIDMKEDDRTDKQGKINMLTPACPGRCCSLA